MPASDFDSNHSLQNRLISFKMPLIIQSSKCATPQLRHHSIHDPKLVEKMPEIQEKFFSQFGKSVSTEPDEVQITPIVSCVPKEEILQSAYQPIEPEITQAGKKQSLLNLQTSIPNPTF